MLDRVAAESKTIKDPVGYTKKVAGSLLSTLPTPVGAVLGGMLQLNKEQLKYGAMQATANVEEERIKQALDLSEEYGTDPSETYKLVAGPEPSLFGKMLNRVKEEIRERTGYFEPPIYGKKYREEQPFRTAGKMAAYYGAESISGLSLTALDVLTNKTVGDKTLAEAVARITGFEPTPEEKQSGEGAKYISALTPVGLGVRAGVGLIPAAQSLKTILGSG